MNITSPAALLRHLATTGRDHPPLIASLATVDPDNIARVRSVVVRGITPTPATLWISSHADARKIRDLRAHSCAELCIWLPSDRLQIRLLARWKILNARTIARSPDLRATRQRAWQSHSSSAQSLFCPPAPTPPATFAVLIATIIQMDALDLRLPQHRRHLHRRTPQGWRSTTIAP